MGEKISGYTQTANSFQDNDLFETSVYLSPGLYVTKKFTWATLKRMSGNETHESGVSAFAGGGQAGATLLEAMNSRVDDVPNDNASVKLSQADTVENQKQNVINSSDTYMLDVYPFEGDNFVGHATDEKITLPPGGSLNAFAYDDNEFTLK